MLLMNGWIVKPENKGKFNESLTIDVLIIRLKHLIIVISEMFIQNFYFK